jgi:hypothetical protein
MRPGERINPGRDGATIGPEIARGNIGGATVAGGATSGGAAGNRGGATTGGGMQAGCTGGRAQP